MLFTTILYVRQILIFAFQALTSSNLVGNALGCTSWNLSILDTSEGWRIFTFLIYFVFIFPSLLIWGSQEQSDMCLKKPNNIVEDSSIVFSTSKVALILQKPISNPTVTFLRCNQLENYLNILNTLNKLFLPLIKFLNSLTLLIGMKGCLLSRKTWYLDGFGFAYNFNNSPIATNKSELVRLFSVDTEFIKHRFYRHCN